MKDTCVHVLQNMNVPVHFFRAVDACEVHVKENRSIVDFRTFKSNTCNVSDSHGDNSNNSSTREHVTVREEDFALFPGWRLPSEEVTRTHERWREFDFEDVDENELVSFYGRSMNEAEIACAASHFTVWREAAQSAANFTLVLEDDVTVCIENFADVKKCREVWPEVWLELQEQIQELSSNHFSWDVLYLGRNRFGQDGLDLTSKISLAGFSSCAHAYVISAQGAHKLAHCSRFQYALMPVDDWLPALYAVHPREDVDDFVQTQIIRAAATTSSSSCCLLGNSSSSNNSSDNGVCCCSSRNSGGVKLIEVVAFKRDRVFQLGSLVERVENHDIISVCLRRACAVAKSDIFEHTPDTRNEISRITEVEYSRALVWLRVSLLLSDEDFAHLSIVCRRVLEITRDEQKWRTLCLQKPTNRACDYEPVISSFQGSWIQTIRREWKHCEYLERKRFNKQACLRRIVDAIETGICCAQIDSTPSAELNTKQFSQLYDRADNQRKPIVMKSFFSVQDRQSCLENLLSTFPADITFSCAVQDAKEEPEFVRMTLRNYYHYMTTQGDDEPLYLFADPPHMIAHMIPTPAYFAENFLEVSTTEHKDLIEKGWIVIGPCGSGSRFHVDPLCTSAWNLLLQGRKLWILGPPLSDDSSSFDDDETCCFLKALFEPGSSAMRSCDKFMNFFFGSHDKEQGKEAKRQKLNVSQPSPDDISSSNQIFWTVQEEGDLLFVPRGWWHCVLNLETCVAFTRNVINRKNYKHVLREVSELRGIETSQFLNELKCWVNAFHF